jgi:hypothetical protein
MGFGESDTLTIVATATGTFINTAYINTVFHDYD